MIVYYLPMEGGGNLTTPIKPIELSEEQKNKLETIKRVAFAQRTQKGSLKDKKEEEKEKVTENIKAKEPEIKNKLDEVHKRTEEELIKTKKVMEALSFMGVKKEDIEKGMKEAQMMQKAKMELKEKMVKEAKRQFIKTVLMVGLVGVLIGSGGAFAIMKYMGSRREGQPVGEGEEA